MCALCRSKSKTATGSPRSARKPGPTSGHSVAGVGLSNPAAGAAPGTPVQVGALDERNLKRAVHRYGTLPKGARIGAYLESLRVAGQPDTTATTPGVEEAAATGGSCSDMTSAGDHSMAVRQLSKGQSQQPMLRYLYPKSFFSQLIMGFIFISSFVVDLQVQLESRWIRTRQPIPSQDEPQHSWPLQDTVSPCVSPSRRRCFCRHRRHYPPTAAARLGISPTSP